MLLSLVFATFILSSAFSPSARWELLGVKKINKSYDRDVISVTATEGTFNALKFKVKYHPVTIYDMKIHYGNGMVEDIKIRYHVQAGGESRIIDLRGRDRVIKKVVFHYETKTFTGRRAEIRLFGLHI
ncbi:MAG: hypothetical protein AMS23_02735 [Bacteroides sp. SM1_62]|nr:MAG: hypothetical protein AMS23_02735 [Bacteroides sp. SM1_62]